MNTTYTPIILQKSELPVMFFIHGGGFEGGTQIQMDAARLGDVANVIVVSINYRVGPIGFMCLNTDEAAGNMGLLDMTMALQWVQDNIGKFGGDPNQVTIFGESAGAAAIGHLVLSNTTEVRHTIMACVKHKSTKYCFRTCLLEELVSRDLLCLHGRLILSLSITPSQLLQNYPVTEITRQTL
jgi:predicted esterase